jgi:hypothetical protein
MPSANSQPPRPYRAILIFLGVVVIAVAIIVALRTSQNHKARSDKAAGNNLQPGADTNTFGPTNVAVVPHAVAPGTLVSAGSVLDKLEKWMTNNPNYHAFMHTTFPNGSLISRMEVFTYTNSTKGAVVRIKGEVLVPQAVTFQAEKENGKLQVYFPKTDQLIAPDTAKMMGAMPALTSTASGIKSLLKLSRTTFAEASADMEVVTMVLGPEALGMPTNSGEAYLSVRIDNQGRLLGTEQQAQGMRVISTMQYLSFDHDLVARGSPALPTGKTARTDKTLQKAMEEEAQAMINKPLRTKI